MAESQTTLTKCMKMKSMRHLVLYELITKLQINFIQKLIKLIATWKMRIELKDREIVIFHTPVC